MQACIQHIREVLLEYDPILYCEEAAILDFTQIRFADGIFSPNHLYILHASELPPSLDSSQLPLGLVCIRDATLPLPQFYKETLGINLITVSEGSNPIDVYNHLIQCVEHSSLDAPKIYTVVEAATSGGLAALTKTVSDLINKSSAVLDPYLKLLSYCSVDTDPNPSWSKMIQYGYHPNYSAPYLLRSDNISCIKNRKITLVSENMFVSGEIFFPISLDKAGHTVAGYLYYYEPGKYFSANTLNLFHFLCDTVRRTMFQFSSATHSFNVMMSSLLIGILDGAISDDSTLISFFDHISAKANRSYVFIVIDLHVSAVEGIAFLLNNYNQIFFNIWEQSYSFLYNNTFVLLVSGNDDVLLDEARLRILNQRLEEYGCFAGVSDSFSQINIHIRNYYHRANAALSMARVISNTGRRYLNFTEVILNYIVKYADLPSSHHLVNPRVLVLLDYDRKHASDYLLTLRCFLLYDKNTRTVCNLLHIHRNTLYYRLKRIYQILQLDIYKTTNMLDLQLSFALLERRGDIDILLRPIKDIPSSLDMNDLSLPV
ncbi:MAG: PucR family transcriptional regulator [Saccharofermentanales bacterium]|jgi:hypothetical protein